MERKNIFWIHLFFRWLVLIFVGLNYFLGVYTTLEIYSSLELLRIGYLIIFLSVYNLFLTLFNRMLFEKIAKLPYLLVSIDAFVCFLLMSLSNGWRSPFFFYSFSPLLVAAFARAYSSVVLAALEMISLYNLALYFNQSFPGILKEKWLETYIANNFSYLLIAVFFAIPSVLAKRLGESYDKLKILQKEIQAKAALEAATEERERIAQDIHDSVGQNLAGAKFVLEAALKKFSSALPIPALERLKYLKTLLLEASRNIRFAIFNLKFPSLKAGFIPFLYQYAQEFSRATGIEVELSVKGEATFLTQEKEKSLYRLLQEALANIMKHAQAQKVKIKLNFSLPEAKLSLNVKDDGKGFNVEEALAQAEAGKSLGLLNMKKAAVELGGDLKFQSGPQKGTTIQVNLPL